MIPEPGGIILMFLKAWEPHWNKKWSQKFLTHVSTGRIYVCSIFGHANKINYFSTFKNSNLSLFLSNSKSWFFCKLSDLQVKIIICHNQKDPPDMRGQTRQNGERRVIS